MDLGSINIWLMAGVLVLFSLGAWIKGLTGMGLPLFAVPAVATLTSVEEAVVLMIIPGLASNLWLVVSHRQHRDQLLAHKGFLIAGFIGGIAGTLLLDQIDDRWLKLVLAVWLALYLLQQFFGKPFRYSLQSNGATAAAVGATAGAIQGATGISSHIVAPYFNNRGILPSAYAFLMATSFLTFSVAQLFTAAGSGLFTPDRVLIGAAALIPTILFTQLGIKYAERVSQNVFQVVLLTVFVLMEIKLIWDII